MAKKIKNPIETKVVKVDGEYEVSAHYGLICDDCEQQTRKGLPVTLKPETLADVNAEIMAQIFEHEGTTEEYVEPE